jgi:hypothetical protein
MDTTTSPAQPTAVLAAAIAMGEALGRKFEAADMDPMLRAAATEYLFTYQGDFDWLNEQKPYLRTKNGLSDGRAKGVLNCLMADVRRTKRQAAAEAAADAPTPIVTGLDLRTAPNGRFRVVLDDKATFVLSLEDATWATNKPKGTRSAGIRIGSKFQFAGFVDLNGQLAVSRKVEPYDEALLMRSLKVLLDGVRDGSWMVWALNYTQDCKQCSFCGTELDDPKSLRVGYGPTCAKKNGLPWGEKAEPMAVILQRAGLATKATLAAIADETKAAATTADDRQLVAF